MELRVEELAGQSGVSVDTVRFYQGRGLLPPPRREGRVALYGDAHAERLRRIRTLVEDGFSLAQVGRLFAREAEAEEEGNDGSGSVEGTNPATGDRSLRSPRPREEAASEDAQRCEPLLAALAEEGVGARVLTRADLARESGMPEAMLTAMQSGGLLEPLVVGGEERYSEADLEMCRNGLAILGAGLPLPELIALATRHARSIEDVAERSIDLFDDFVRKPASSGPDGSDASAERAIEHAFKELLPQVTRLVALHFQRTLVRGAIERLRASGSARELEEALAATESARLEVEWR